jgi:hypothetical protein
MIVALANADQRIEVLVQAALSLNGTNVPALGL